jgi:two-component system NtrC family sensor kinase
MTLIGKPAIELIAAMDRPRLEKDIKELYAGGAIKNIEYAFLAKDGREFPGEMRAAPFRDKSDNIVGSVVIAKDITDRKKMEEQLILTDRLASIGQLASGIAHELNNPLTGIIGLSELIMKKDIPQDIKEDLEIINSQAQRTARHSKRSAYLCQKARYRKGAYRYQQHHSGSAEAAFL